MGLSDRSNRRIKITLNRRVPKLFFIFFLNNLFDSTQHAIKRSIRATDKLFLNNNNNKNKKNYLYRSIFFIKKNEISLFV